jgi:glycosyltransferase involved in cell wall biosynthesis
MVKAHGVADPGPRSISPSQSRVVLFVGRLSHEKGVSSLLDAWVTASVGGLNLTIVGDGPLRRALEERQIPGVTFLGWRRPEEVQSLMLSARTLVFPSICYEGLPYAVIEALAAGLPVMASGLGSVGDILEQLGPDWLATPPSGPGWASALGRLASRDTIDAAGQRARQLYEGNYTVEHSADRLLKIYSESIRAAGQA